METVALKSGASNLCVHNCRSRPNELRWRCLAEAGDLLDDVVVGVLEPFVEGDGAALVGVHRLEVLLALREPLLQTKDCHDLLDLHSVFLSFPKPKLY